MRGLDAWRCHVAATWWAQMIRLMDANSDGCIGWNEFESFMREVTLASWRPAPSRTRAALNARLHGNRSVLLLPVSCLCTSLRLPPHSIHAQLHAASPQEFAAGKQLLSVRGWPPWGRWGPLQHQLAGRPSPGPTRRPPSSKVRPPIRASHRPPIRQGEYLLPSGTALPFGEMVSKLKRARLMGDVTAGGEARAK